MGNNEYYYMFLVLGCIDKDHYAVWNYYNGDYDIITYEDAYNAEEWNYFNAYIDTAEKKIKGFNIDFEHMPFIKEDVPPNYYVFMRDYGGDKVFRQPYGDYAYFDLQTWDSDLFSSREYAKFLTDNTVYGGVGDIPDYYWRFRGGVSGVDIVIPHDITYEKNTSVSSMLRDYKYIDYLKIPFGIKNLNFDDLFYSCIIKNVELSKSVEILDFAQSNSYSTLEIAHIKIPSGVKAIYGLSKKTSYDRTIFECNPKSDAWSLLENHGLGSRLMANYKI